MSVAVGIGDPVADHAALSGDPVLGLAGWESRLPIQVTMPHAEIPGLRRQITRDIALLLPRCRALDQTLPPELLCHHGYVASKQHRHAVLSLAPVAAGPAMPPRRALPLSLQSTQAAASSRSEPVTSLLREAVPLLVVGSSFGPQLQQLEARHPSIQVVTAEVAAATATDDKRPPRDSLPGWLAATDEVERAAIGAILLGRDSGRADVELLLDRLHPHQRLIVEPGAATVPWLFALWDGVATRHDSVLVFSEPGHRFREPSTRMMFEGEPTWPRISVITVSFNQREYLEQCLHSVLDQGYPNLEYIVVDGGSTDGSVEVLERFRHRLTRLIIEPDHGQSDGLNKGLGHATGEIVTWVNSDDMLAPLAMRRVALAFARSGADIVAGTCSRISAEGLLHYRHHSILPVDATVPLQLRSVINWSEWEKGCYFFQPEVFFSRDIWLRAGGYLKPYLHWAMDWDLWLRFALAGARAVRTPDVLGVSREHPAQKTRGDEMYLWQILNLLREYNDLLTFLEDSTTTARLDQSRNSSSP